MSQGFAIGEEKSYPDFRQKNTDRIKSSFDLCHARVLLREVHGLDDRIQLEENANPLFLLGIHIHGRNARVAEVDKGSRETRSGEDYKVASYFHDKSKVRE